MSWLIVYNGFKNKKGGIYIICITILNTLNIIFLSNVYSKLLLSPLIVWLLFALLLNSFEVQMDSKQKYIILKKY